MTAQSLLSSTILKRVMTVFLFVLTQKRVMALFNDNMLGLMRVMCGTGVTLLSFGTREYGPMGLEGLVGASESRNNLLRPSTHLQMLNMSHSSFSIWEWNCSSLKSFFWPVQSICKTFSLQKAQYFLQCNFLRRGKPCDVMAICESRYCHHNFLVIGFLLLTLSKSDWIKKKTAFSCLSIPSILSTNPIKKSLEQTLEDSDVHL